MQHALANIRAEHSALIAECSCGWATTAARSETHARKRWRLHSIERRTNDRAQMAEVVCQSLRQRRTQLAVQRSAAQRRRFDVRTAHLALLRSLKDADAWADQFRPPRWRVLECARQLSELSTLDLWLRYIAVGGDHDLVSFASMLDGTAPLMHHDGDLITIALNEEFRDKNLGAPIPFRRNFAAIT